VVSIEVLSREIRISILIKELHGGVSRHKFLDLYISMFVYVLIVIICLIVNVTHVYIYGNNLYVYILVHG
jgi:hypothetical protein